MGIPGVYKQIGPGERTALSKLAVEHLETTGRPLRLAIDVSIWQFQIQSGQGGKNPALRTFYYRLLRLLALSIHPLFVFDGPNRPAFKRNVKINPYAASLDTFLIKQLLKPFGFPFHTAPGEAEAECALLQKEGIVDAVLSEDVDTMMFGCTITLKNWTAEGRRGNKTPTHVNLFTAEATKNGPAGLDSEGMILIALMSGGDYMTAGIPGCGAKIAAEAARAGFGRDLCALERGNREGLRRWKERLGYELHTNESGFFGRKHKAISIPDSFPDETVFGYYTHPVISSPEKVVKLRQEIPWNMDVNVPELRQFVSEAFNWPYLTGAKHFIRGLAPALLVSKLVKKSTLGDRDDQSFEEKAETEARLIKTISSKRAHWITDGAPELRIAYIPSEIVGLDLDAEERDDYRGIDDDASGADEAGSAADESAGRSKSPTKKPSAYDPTQIEKIWVLETHVKLGVPLLVETWEEDMRNPKKFASRKARERTVLAKAKAKVTGGMRAGALDQFVKLGKPGVQPMPGKIIDKAPNVTVAALPPVFLAPTASLAPGSPLRRALAENTNLLGNKEKAKAQAKAPNEEPVVRKKPSKAKKPDAGPTASPSSRNNRANPWTLSRRPTDTFEVTSPSRYSALGIYAPGDPETQDIPSTQHLDTRNSAQAPASPPVTPSTTRTTRTKKHTRSPSSSSSEPNLPQPTPTHQKAASTLATPPKDTDSPSQLSNSTPTSRKSQKLTPLHRATSLYLSGQLKTPTSTRTCNRLSDLHDSEEHEGEEEEEPTIPLTDAITVRKSRPRPNRKLFFKNTREGEGEVAGPLSPQLSETESLPSPSALLSPKPRPKPRGAVDGEKVAKREIMETLASPTKDTSDHPAGPCKKGDRRKTAGGMVQVRQSLEGAWMLVEPGEAEAKVKMGKIFGSVEVLDMTGEI